MARELGRAIQADERYKAYFDAKEINDADEGLQSLIGEFNLLRQKITAEMNKGGEERNPEKIDELNTEAQSVYSQIMGNESMIMFTAAKNAMDNLIRDVSGIISLCCDGEDPDTCQIEPEPISGCASGGGCSGCGKH